MSVDVKYSTSATATGGRDGQVRSEDGKIDVALAVPQQMGGPGGEGTNPEQLFAAGYSACFLGALKVAGGMAKQPVPGDTTVTATVGIGSRSEGGYGIAVTLRIDMPGVAAEDARRLVDAAHGVCPYSNATRNNVDVILEIA